jgi:two-component system chemotaxis response regulator CheY
MRIMVVDDDRTTRKILGLYLKGKGYEPVFAENGLDAIEKLAGNEVDLILTDLNMPYMDGIELTRTLKNDPSFKSIPILMITTENDDVERKKAAEAGIDAYMIKPVSAESVNATIKQMLNIK